MYWLTFGLKKIILLRVNGPSTLRRRMGVSAVILVAYDVGYGERMQELQREVLILPM